MSYELYLVAMASPLMELVDVHLPIKYYDPVPGFSLNSYVSLSWAFFLYFKFGSTTRAAHSFTKYDTAHHKTDPQLKIILYPHPPSPSPMLLASHACSWINSTTSFMHCTTIGRVFPCPRMIPLGGDLDGHDVNHYGPIHNSR
jgi:hypothetical protein